MAKARGNGCKGQGPQHWGFQVCIIYIILGHHLLTDCWQLQRRTAQEPHLERAQSPAGGEPGRAQLLQSAAGTARFCEEAGSAPRGLLPAWKQQAGEGGAECTRGESPVLMRA
jgi:hypothetical protein